MIYLDNNATTQPTDRVVEAVLFYMTECYFNASASTAAITRADRPRYEAACAMAKLLNAEEPDCFTFTSGATESNNWVFSSFAKGRESGRILLSAIEHASIAEPAAELARAGFEIVEVAVDTQGTVRLDILQDALKENTGLISIMAANNETGVLQPIGEIGHMIREHCPTALFHTDATQAVGKIPIDLQSEWQDVDLLSFSAHKFHGPKGIGGLYARPGLELGPMTFGGGQENGRRSGTTNTPGLAGLAAAATEAWNPLSLPIQELRDGFETYLKREFPKVVIHSQNASRLPNTSFFSLFEMSGEAVSEVLAENGIIVGTGSACASGALEPSPTLRSMGVSHDLANAGLRVSLSRFSGMQDIVALIDQLKNIQQRREQQCQFTHTDDNSSIQSRHFHLEHTPRTNVNDADQ